MVNVNVRSDGAFIFIDDKGQSAAKRLNETTLLVEMEGFMCQEHFLHVSNLHDKIISETGKIVICGDAEFFTGYETAFRESWGKWFKEHRDQIVDTHTLMRSTIIKMGMQVIKLFSNMPLTAYTDRVRWTYEVCKVAPNYEPILKPWRVKHPKLMMSK